MSDEENQDYEVVEGHHSVLGDMTELEIASIRKLAVKYVQSDEQINRIGAVIISSRQIYALARLALTRELAERGHCWQDGVEEYILQAMINQSNVQFSRDRTLQSVQSSLLPFLVDEIHAEHKAVLRREAEAQRLEEERRRASPVYFAGEMLRGDSVVLVADNITKVMSEITQGCNGDIEGQDTPVTIHLRAVNIPETKIDRDADKYYVEVGLNKWVNCSSSEAQMSKLFDKVLASVRGGHCDRLVCDNLVLAHTVGISGTSAARHAMHAHKALKKWAKAHDAILVGGAVGDEEFQEELDKLLGKHTTIKRLAETSGCSST